MVQPAPHEGERSRSNGQRQNGVRGSRYALDEDEIFRLGTACRARRREGDLREADKLAWRMLHRLDVQRPHEIEHVNLMALIGSISPKARGPLSTMFLQVGQSLAFHGRRLEAFWFAERAAGLFSKDAEAYQLVHMLALGKQIHPREKRIETFAFDDEERRRQQLVVLDLTERFLSFRFNLDPRLETLESVALAEIPEVSTFLAAVVAGTECGAVAVKSFPSETPKQYQVAERTLRLGDVLFLSVGMPLDPSEASSSETLQVAAPQKNYEESLAALSSVYRAQREIYELIKDEQRSVACQSLAEAFAAA